jgi:hypothetical protein
MPRPLVATRSTTEYVLLRQRAAPAGLVVGQVVLITVPPCARALAAAPTGQRVPGENDSLWFPQWLPSVLALASAAKHRQHEAHTGQKAVGKMVGRSGRAPPIAHNANDRRHRKTVARGTMAALASGGTDVRNGAKALPRQTPPQAR